MTTPTLNKAPPMPGQLPTQAGSATQAQREARLVTALYHCPAGRRLLEDARSQGIQLGSTRNPGQATPLHLSSTAVFMIQDVHALCRQVNPQAPASTHFERASTIAAQLIDTANRFIHAEPIAKLAQTRQPAKTPAVEFQQQVERPLPAPRALLNFPRQPKRMEPV